MRNTPRFASLLLSASLATSLAALCLPAGAESIASSASSAGSASSGSVSDSLENSSNSSSKDKKVAQGEYQVIAAAPAQGRPDTTRLQLRSTDPMVAAEFYLLVPSRAMGGRPLHAGDKVMAAQRDYGFEFARAENREPFFLVLNDDWHRELQSHPVTL
ncbi:hypothetical protein [Roseateles amylovorans]|uniref:Uncharacterized protein n=1 Tax=Roseateles amylovorans TaxID=2978473 RepID=A0ABY6AUM6_9BURK|nr:hypothetical protein [Roseateles amylovorans]UXH76919.1 hypothetical protein N4261_18060 [Roseateles amylovorans]